MTDSHKNPKKMFREFPLLYLWRLQKSTRPPSMTSYFLKGQLNKGTLKRCLVFQGTCGDKSVELVVKFERNSRNT